MMLPPGRSSTTLRRGAGALVAALLMSAPAWAQARRLTIDDIYDPDKKADFTGNPPANLIWTDDEHYIWPKTDARTGTKTTEYFRVEARTGRTERLFDPARLEAVLARRPGVKAEEARALAADAATASLSVQYLDWFVPALFLQFPLVAMGAAFRGLGDLKVPTAIQVGTVILNIVLAPTLMFGWLGGRPLGVAGTGLASLIAVAAACVAFTLYFRRPASPVRFRRKDWRPRPRLWLDMLQIGLPAGGEFALVSVYMVLVYVLIRPFGSGAQAGFGIGLRVVQSLFLPVVAIAFATAPVVGQNYGARLGDRVRQAFTAAAGMSAVVMVVLTLLCRAAPAALVRFFNADPAVVAFGSEYLRIISLNFLASGIVFVSSSVFQGIGNTLPPLASSSLRLVLFALPAFLLSRRPGFELWQVWYLSVASVTLQLVANVWLLHREFERRLGGLRDGGGEPAVAST
jgi:putative MATE family efflux protein